MSTLKVGIYGRISEDPRQKEAGVKRQEQDGRALCAMRGWEVADVYVDNDISALRGKYRPAYERLLADVRSGKVTHVVAYGLSRLWRNRRERAAAIELFSQLRVSVTLIKGGEIDLSSAAGRAVAGLLGEMDTMESEIKSERVARAAEARAEEGRANAHVAYGWRRERVRNANGDVASWWDVEDPEQAKIVREIVERLLAGDPVKTIATDLNRRQVPPPRASLIALNDTMPEQTPDEAEKFRPQQWLPSTVRKIALRPANIGKRTRGVYETKGGKRRRVRMEVIGDAAWPAIVDEEKHHEVVAMLNDPARATSRSGARKHLLSFGIGRCGICGGELRVKCYSGNARRAGRTAYICNSPRSCTGRSQYQVDRLVGYLVCGFLAHPDFVDLLVADDAGAKEARAKAAHHRSKLAQAQDDYDQDLITREMYVRSVKRHRAAMEEAEETARRSSSGLHDVHTALAVAGPEAERKWGEIDIVRRRALLEALDTEVTLLPTKRGPGFKPESVRVQCMGVDLGSSTG
jgi:DNA invertase Pin-like site-specific DNA recombinase